MSRLADIDYSALPTQQAYKVSAPDVDPIAQISQDVDQSIQDIRPVMSTNDVNFVWTTGEPGDVIPWHTHVPSIYQILVTIEGDCMWYYKDNDGEEQTIHTGPGDVIYLPGGAANKVEVTGDSHHTHLGIYPKTPIPRVEQQLGIGGNVYDPRSVNYGLWYDNVRDEVVTMDESVCSY